MSNFNGEMLRLARQYRGYTQSQVSDGTGIDAPSISRFENNIVQPTETVAEKFVGFLKLPMEFFTQSERVYGLPVSVHPMWRKKAATLQSSVDRALAEFNIRIMHLRRMLNAIDYAPVLPLPELDVESYGGDVEAIATLVRRTWLMPAGAVVDLTSWVERAGVFVIYMDLPEAAMSGVTLRMPDVRPCIFLNKNMPADRMRFTLAHELGHLVMHRVPTLNMEDEANQFASAFLMPKNDIRPSFQGRKIDLRLLASLKPDWKVSMQSLLMRATGLGYVTDNQARYLWVQFNKFKYRMREPAELDFPIENPSLLPKLLSLHSDNLGYSLQDFAAITKMYEQETALLYGLGASVRRQSLRLV